MAFSQYALPKAVDLTDKALVKKVFDGGREGTIRTSKGKFLSKKDLASSKYPGQTFDIEVSIGVHRVRMYLTENSIIQIIVAGSKEFVNSPEAKKFLDSLKIEE